MMARAMRADVAAMNTIATGLNPESYSDRSYLYKLVSFDIVADT